MWGTEWPRFEVIKQDTQASPPQMVGSVHAADPEHALLVARHVFVRRPSAYALFVAPAEAFFHVSQEGLKDLKPSRREGGSEEPYWVFAKRSHRRSMVYGDLVGRFLAQGPEDAVAQALLQAQGVAFWAVPERLVVGTEPTEEVVESWFAPAKEKTYRLQSYYGLITAKGVENA
ncbi:phenylacetic acid degradation protein [Thermus antranikianii]|uniref:Phenylacetic acid degradation protein n=1 Tax=Thermus antranikianii TaxID=88190 RepID=A0ABY7RQQ1_9DEIN|nr:phenylacetic acid degradation protein [Thermus antranikianii]QWK21549.1 MAG: phenylacetic acid degradation protein [Thermus antranikianii]WCM39676.1 phenylacetic acid degradation protein [Thermus antranikianii]